jgi:hypothetical protein
MTGFPTIDAILLFGSVGALLVCGVLAVFPRRRHWEDEE